MEPINLEMLYVLNHELKNLVSLRIGFVNNNHISKYFAIVLKINSIINQL